MDTRLHATAALVAACLLWPGTATASKAAWEEVGELIKGASTVTAHGPTLFGDEVSLQSGTLSFRVTDVSLRGNNALPVEITRTFRTKTGGGAMKNAAPDPNKADGAMGDWEIDLPHVGGVFALSTGWINSAAGKAARRCSVAHPDEARAPSVKPNSLAETFPGTEIWHGTRINIPGRGSMAMLVRGTQSPQPVAGGAYWITSDWTSVACLPSIINGSGEGFIATTADGTRYWFNWMAVAHEQRMARQRYSSATIDYVDRGRFGLYATRVQDRFNNWVEFKYANGPGEPVRLSSIESSDGRTIVLTHYTGAQGLVKSVRAGTRTWTYGYSSGATGLLTSVTLPDASRWSISLPGFQGLKIRYHQGQPGQESWRSCTNPGSLNGNIYEGVVSHPSGATGRFVLKPLRFERDGIDPATNCALGNPNDPNDDTEYYPSIWDAYALVEKRVEGPGLEPMLWSYHYDSGFATEVTGPRDFTRYAFGNTFRRDEGKLLVVERGSGPDDILTREDTGFELARTGQPWPLPIGIGPQPRGEDYGEEYLRPLRTTKITRQGVTFNRRVEQFDVFARPLAATAWSSLGDSRSEATTYHDDMTRWVLGQVETQRRDGVEVSRTGYSANMQPEKEYSFGKLRQSMAYYGDGTLAAITDGNQNTVTLSDWKRGLPQTVMFPVTPDQPIATRRLARIDNDGWIRATTDENGYETTYDYDDMGRLSQIGYPVGDSTVWNSTDVSFSASPDPQYGLPAGHWQQVVSTGAARKITYFDAFWRPVVEETFDNNDAESTRSVTVRRHDAGGRATFVSYPRRSLGSFLDPTLLGTWTAHDAIDRITSVSQDSELGPLRTETEYLDAFTTRVTNPRNAQTSTSYRAYDQPTFDEPRVISHPEGAYTEIHRDVFGKPMALRRRNADASEDVWRYYVYDAYQRLCRTTEPESGITVIGYDAADNVLWSAGGLPLPPAGASTCDNDRAAAYDSGRRVDRTYDARNRLMTVAFPDGTGNQAWSYTPDGLPDHMVTQNNSGGALAINAYSYDRRRQMVGEAVEQPGWYSWAIGYARNANGDLQGQRSPTGLYIDFAPDALGRPSRAGAYATGVRYHPNGAIERFTYGNGLVHTMGQNDRQLPRHSIDGSGALDHEYTYDQAGNVTFIRDDAQGALHDRGMAYDDLDRLKTATSCSFGGDCSHRFTYDALDNIKSWTLGGVKDYANYHYEQGTNRLTNVQDSRGATVVGMGYDAQGNLANKNGHWFAFDMGNRLRTVIRKQGGSEVYRYDGHGRRIVAWRSTGGLVLSQYTQAGQLTYQVDTEKGKSSDYVYLGGSLVAVVSYSLANAADQDVTYQHTDALGSPVAVTNAAGQVIDRMQYEPYGAVIGRPGHDGVGYTGHVMDGATGLTYMQQRYYDPQVGRFLSVDPVAVDASQGGKINRYRYAANNPFAFLDPDGREEVDFLKKARGKIDRRSLDSHPTLRAANGSSVSIRSESGGKGGSRPKIGSAARSDTAYDSFLLEYVNIEDVSAAVDGAPFSLGEWRGGRFIYTEGVGWIDLKHVAWSARMPLGSGLMLGFSWELSQRWSYPASFMERSDINGNTIGALVSLRATSYFVGRHGELAQRIIQMYRPLSYEDASTKFSGLP